jgi:osmotically-inducible protein OsmY
MKGDDNELKKRGLAALRFDDRLDAASLALDVDGRDGVVALTGTVQHPWQKFRAQWVLEQVPGVVLVENLVLVEPFVHRTDEEIANELWAAFLQDPYLDERTIISEVEEGVVYLHGHVPSLVRMRLAGVLAWWRAGVYDVVVDIDVEHPETDGNEELAEAIRVALEKDPLVDGSAVAMHVVGQGLVILSGALRSPEAREAAENDAWCVQGVHAVDNRLWVIPPGRPEERFEPGR